MINHGEFKSVRSTTNHPETTDQAQQIDVGGGQQNGASTPEAAFGDTKSSAGSAGTPPEAVTALQELLAKVEAGAKYGTMGHTLLCQKAFPKPEDFDGSREAYANSDAQLAVLAWRNGSLDATKALHEAVLPEWEWQIGSGDAYLETGDPGKEWTFRTASADNIDPARAWLIAILKALIAQGQIT
jgi:hypothetical protein